MKMLRNERENQRVNEFQLPECLAFKLEDISPAWCEPENSHKEMDVELALAFQKIANRLLTDRLAALPTAYAIIDADGVVWLGTIPARMDTHETRFLPLWEIAKK